MKICVIGGGNIGTLLTAELANKGYEVSIFTKKSKRFKNEISVYSNEDQLLFKSHGYKVTNNLCEALSEAEYIWITYPAFLFDELSEELIDYVKCGQKIVCMPGSGGAEFAFSKLVKKGVILCGLQRVHCITRIKEFGSSVYELGRKESVHLGTVPAKYSQILITDFVKMLSMKCYALPNYLSVTLTPSNPILHTSRLYSIFKEYHDGVYYNHNILFYKEWSDDSSRTLFLCDQELQSLCKSVIEMDLNSVVSLKKHYESSSPETLTKKIASISAYQNIYSPMKKTPNGWVPDFSSRYFKADFNYGLKILIDIAGAIGTKVTEMEKIWEWYLTVNPKAKEESFNLRDKCIYDYYQ